MNRRSTLRRACSLITFYPLAFSKTWKLAKRGAVVITTTDPPLQLVVGALLKKFRHMCLVHWSQDVYPETAEALGALPANGWLANGLRMLARWALGCHDRIVVIGRCMQKRLESSVSAQKIIIIENWADTAVAEASTSATEARAVAFRQAWGLEKKFIIMYAGNFGLAHPLELVLEAAQRLREMPDVHFLLVGEGPQLEKLEKKTRAYALPNIQFLPRQPREQLAGLLSAADLHLVLLEPSLEGLVVPSKAYNIFSVERACLFVGPPGSEISRTISEIGAGETIEALSAQLLVQAILRWKVDPARLSSAGAAARTYSRQHAQAAALEKWAQLLESIH